MAEKSIKKLDNLSSYGLEAGFEIYIFLFNYLFLI
jgi:hypothetical protein